MEVYDMEKQWKLGVDIQERDNIFDNITFADIIETVQNGERIINEEAVRRVVKRIIDIQMQDMNYLLNNNMNVIIKLASS